MPWNAYDLGKRINNSTYVFKGIIFFDVPPSHDGSNELMFLEDGVGVYNSKVNDTGSTRDMTMELVSDNKKAEVQASN